MSLMLLKDILGLTFAGLVITSAVKGPELWNLILIGIVGLAWAAAQYVRIE